MERSSSRRVVRLAMDRSQTLARQSRILRSPSVIEVPDNMYARRSGVEME